MSAPEAHASQPQASRSTSASGRIPSDVWKSPRTPSKTIRLESRRSIPAYARSAAFDGVARPVTPRTFEGPKASRIRRTAATNPRGDRSYSGPFAKKMTAAGLAASRSVSLVTIAKSPARGSCGTSMSARERGKPFDGGRSSANFTGREAKKLPLTRIWSRGSSVRSRTSRASANPGAGRRVPWTNRTRGVASSRPPRVHTPFRPRPPCSTISNMGEARMTNPAKKESATRGATCSARCTRAPSG